MWMINTKYYFLQEPDDIEQKAENDEDSNETFKNNVQIQLDNKSSLESSDNYEKPSEIHEKPSIEVSKELSCDDCNKSFSTKWNLKVHERLYTGEKSFSCTYCHVQFTQISVEKT